MFKHTMRILVTQCRYLSCKILQVTLRVTLKYKNKDKYTTATQDYAVYDSVHVGNVRTLKKCKIAGYVTISETHYVRNGLTT